MSTPIITWIVISGLFLLILLTSAIANLAHRQQNHRMPRLIEIGSEREELYVPGDSIREDDLNDE